MNCSIQDCPKEPKKRGMCASHYQQVLNRQRGRTNPNRPIKAVNIAVREPIPVGVYPKSRVIASIPSPTGYCVYPIIRGNCQGEIVYDGYCREHMSDDLRWSWTLDQIKRKAHGL